MQESDELNQHELFTIVKKSNVNLELEISSNNYEEQKQVFMDGLKKDKKSLKVLKSMLLNILGKS
jgi:hypothetical protein